MNRILYVLHYNAIHPVRCRHYTIESARAEVSRQIRDFRRLGISARTLEPGQKWAIGAEVVRIVSADRVWKDWPRGAEPAAMLRLTLQLGEAVRAARCLRRKGGHNA